MSDGNSQQGTFLQDNLEQFGATVNGSARPIFVIGALRSGSSILTSALGQHPNIRPVAENSWLPVFADGLRRSFSAGVERRDISHLEASGIDIELFMLYFGESVNKLLLHPPGSSTSIPLDIANDDDYSIPAAFTGVTYRPQRWVDGTLEHLWHSIDLWRMFPAARFLHVVRDLAGGMDVMTDPDTRSAFRSRTLVLSESDARQHWLDAARAGLQAEQALGSGIVMRVLRSDLLENPESEMRRVLDFVDEPYDARVLRVFR